MFRGRYVHAIDSKGRTSFPSRFREVLAARSDARIVITSGLETCLVAYPMGEWLEFEERLSALPKFDPDVAMLRRIYVSGAVECELDRLGRILVPANLRSHAELSRDVIWAGMGKHIELWAKGIFESLHHAVLSDESRRKEMARKLAELGL